MTAKGTLPQPLPMATRLEAKRLWEAGESYNAVAAVLNVAASSIKTWRKRDAWSRKPESSDEFAIVEPVAIEPDATDLTLEEAAEEYEQNMRAASVIVSRRIAKMEPDQVISRADRIKQIDATARKALRIETEKPFVAIQIGVLASSPAKRDNELRLHSAVRPRELSE